MSTGFESREQSRAGQVEMVHFWEEGDGQRMVETVIDAFEAEYPGIDVTEQSYSSHGLALKSRILQENPPPVFVEWAGRNLIPYHRAGALRDLTELWEQNGWTEAFVDGPREGAMVDGDYLGVPIDIHRMNNLFYHVDMVEEFGLDPGSIADPEAFLDVLRQLDDAGITGMPVPMKDPETVLTLWSNICVAQFGPDAFFGITRGRTADYRREIEGTTRLLDGFVDLNDEDATFMSMVDANERFQGRDSVFFQQGDWVAGEYLARDGFEYGEDWERVNFPGSDGVYMMGMDVLVAAAGAPFTDDVRSFLEFVGSREGLELLNRTKGSLPPRTDVPMDDFPTFLKHQFEDFQAATEFPMGMSMMVTPDKFIDAQTALSGFVADRDVERTTRDLVAAFEDE